MAYRAHYACAYIQDWDPETLQAPQRVGLTPGYPQCVGQQGTQALGRRPEPRPQLCP